MKFLQKLPYADHLIPSLLFLFVSSVYFMTVTGITASNDGSQYAAARAFADYGSFDIAPYLAFVEEQDYSLDRYGVAHSHLPPGTSLIASVTYRIGQLAPEPFVQVPSRHDPDNPHVIYAVLASVLAGSGAVLLLYNILREHFQASASAALLTALAFAFATTTWKYSAVLYLHSLASFSLLAALYLMLRAERQGIFAPRTAFLLGLALGASVLFEFSNAILVIIALLYLALVWGGDFLAALRRPGTRRPWLETLGAAAVGSLPPLVFFLAYNAALYGGPFKLSFYAVDPVRWACCATPAANLSGSIPRGIQSLLLYRDSNQGLFLLSPVSILAPLGWKALYRHTRRNLLLLLGTFAVFLVLLSKLSVTNPGTDDSRYLTPYLGLWFIPLGLWLDRTYFRIRGEILRTLVSLLFFGLLFVSIRNMAAHIAFSWGYDLNLTDLERRSVSPANLALIGSALFPNAPNLPLLWLLEAAAGTVGLAFAWGRRALAPRLRPALDAAALALIAAYALAPAADALRDPQPPGMTPLEASFGSNLHLVGYQLSEWNADPQPGDPVRVRLYWQLDSPTDETPQVELTLVGEDGAIWSQTKTPLGLATFRRIPPPTWPAGRITQEEYTLPLASPPPYWLETDLLLTVGDQSAALFALRPATLTVAASPAHPLAYQFEALARLTGYDARPLPYHRLAVTLHWQVTSATDTAYTTFIHLTAADGTIVAQSDAQPFKGRFPTTDWQPGQTLVDTYIIQLGRAFQPGTYSLRTGFYDPADGSRLPVTDAAGQPVRDSTAILGEVTLP